MPTQWEPNCLRLLLDIAKDLGAIRASVNDTRKWPVPRMEDLIDRLSVLRGTNLVGSVTFGYLEPNEKGVDLPIRFPCHEEAIENITKSWDYWNVQAEDVPVADGPLEALQTLVEQELYSKGSAWFSLEEKRAETVNRIYAEGVLADFEQHWEWTVNSLIRWHDINPMLGYQRPYAQEVP